MWSELLCYTSKTTEPDDMRKNAYKIDGNCLDYTYHVTGPVKLPLIRYTEGRVGRIVA